MDWSRPLRAVAGGENWGWSSTSVSTTPPYNTVGAVLTDGGRGSGCTVLPHIVLSCAHVLLDDRGNWNPNIRWSRARTPSNTSTVSAAQSYVSSTYRSRLQRGFANGDAAAFSHDWGFLAFYSTGAGLGSAPMFPGYLSSLASGNVRGFYEVVGYPAGLYTSSSDPRRDEMHSTNPGMTHTRFTRGANFYDNGVLYQSEHFTSPDGVLYISPGNSGGPMFTSHGGVKYVVGIAVASSRTIGTIGVRELTSSLYNTLVSYNEAYKSWVSSRVGSRRTGSPVKVNQAWRQAYSVDGSGRLQATFFNGAAWQTVSLGGEVLNYGTSLFDIHTQRGWIFYIGNGDIWLAYPTAAGWQHAKVFDYPAYRSGDPYPVGVSVDAGFGVVGIQESNNNTRMLHLSSWTTAPSSVPAGRFVSNTKWGPMAWDYRAGSPGIVGRFFHGGWRSVDLTSRMVGVLPGDASLTTTLDGRMAPFLGGVVFASQQSTLEMLYPSGSLWNRWFIQSGVEPQSWVAVDNVRNIIYFRRSDGYLSFVTMSTTWQRTDTDVWSDRYNAAAVLEAFGTLFHGHGTDLNVVARY